MKKMMKLLLSLVMAFSVLAFSGAEVFAADVTINATNFPNATFRSYISENFDTDKNGKLSSTEIGKVKSIDVSNTDVDSVKGVEYFTSLELLECSYAYITSLDVSKNTNLKELYCMSNNLTSLNVTNNLKLEYLDCSYNPLTSINVKKNTELKSLSIDATDITSIDVTQNKYLWLLSLYYSSITSVDVTKNPNLEALYVDHTDISSLDISKNPNLRDLYICNTKISSLNISNNPRLSVLSCYGNSVKKLDITHNYYLSNVYRTGEKTTRKEAGIEHTLYTTSEDAGYYGYFDLGTGITVTLNPFKDVKTTDNYFDSLMWAYGFGIVSGTSSTTFSPNGDCTRAQMAVMLWRLRGKPKPFGTGSFKDISSLSANVQTAINWCYSEGIVSGYSDGTYRPNNPVTRAQMAIMLWRMAGTPEPSSSSTPFKDLKGCSAQVKKAIAWAYEAGITKGTSSTTFGPDEKCLRKQLVIFLKRLNDYYCVVW